MFKSLFFAAWAFAATLSPASLLQERTAAQTIETKTVKIQLALLLDTSGSMDGLIGQAKTQLWKMVTELATCKKNGKIPEIELALYEYGKSTLPADKGYLQQIVPLTTDLDLVSEKLFELRTNGGEEYCGWVIQDATDNLAWSTDNDDLKIIFIAGNEPFNQGNVNYKDACKKAISKGIIVNTIFCGQCQEGINTNWKDGADLADGKYMCINQNESVVHVASPFDAELSDLSNKINDTYLSYGSSGNVYKERQMKQDANAQSSGSGVSRAAAKASSAYNNASWDLVDASKGKKAEEVVKDLKENELPEEMRKMSEKERVAYLEAKTKERAEIQAKIVELNAKREKYVAEELKKQGAKNTLDDAMLNSLREQATQNKFTFEPKAEN